MDEYIKRMVDEFLRWKLPADFAPDGGISHNFGHLTPTSPLWPVGTNLFTASQATDMFARCANSLIEDLARKDADCHSNGLRVETLESELSRVREELEIERANFPAIGSPLQKLGALLADLLDEDRFAQAEQLLLSAHADKERVARRAYWYGRGEHKDGKPFNPDEAVAQAMQEVK